MQWSDYAKMAGGIYTPEIKQTASNRNKLIVAEGLSSKNLLKMPPKAVLEDKMSKDLKKFVSGKPILNEIAPALAPLIPALVGAGEAGAAGVAATGVAGAAGGAVAGETAAAGAAAAGQTAASSLAADTAAGVAAAPESGSVVAQQATQTNAGKAWDIAKSAAANTNVDTNPQQTSHPNEQVTEDFNSTKVDLMPVTAIKRAANRVNSTISPEYNELDYMTSDAVKATTADQLARLASSKEAMQSQTTPEATKVFAKRYHDTLAYFHRLKGEDNTF